MPNTTNNSRPIQSLVRAISILTHLETTGNRDSLTNISRSLGLSKSTAYSLIATLEQLGFVQQDPDSARYSLGMRLFEIGQVVHDSMDIRKIALSSLTELVAKYGETAHLGVLSQSEVVYIEKVNGLHSMSINSKIGGRNPAYCTGVGKVLLAFVSSENFDHIIRKTELKQFTAKTITDPAHLKQHLVLIRHQGYAVDDEEIESGLRCVAAPIYNYRQEVIAAISLSAPIQRMDLEKLPQVIADVVSTAKVISSQLGHKY